MRWTIRRIDLLRVAGAFAAPTPAGDGNPVQCQIDYGNRYGLVPIDWRKFSATRLSSLRMGGLWPKWGGCRAISPTKRSGRNAAL